MAIFLLPAASEPKISPFAKRGLAPGQKVLLFFIFQRTGAKNMGKKHTAAQDLVEIFGSGEEGDVFLRREPIKT